MSLVGSFLHHCLAHPLLFVADVAREAGLPRVAALLELPHDLGPGPDASLGPLGAPTSDDQDETEGLPIPPPAPLTDAARAMLADPPPAPPPAPPPPPPLKGSVADRMRHPRYPLR